MIDEEVICESFRCFQGKGYFLGVKEQWWAKLVTSEEPSKEIVMRWKPTVAQITMAERLLFDLFLKLSDYERRLLIVRCGRGYKKSYRKCGKDLGVHHEVFRKSFQSVIKKLQKLLDE